MNKAETARSLGLPKDVVFGMPVINITGNMQVVVQNFKSIVSYETTEVRLTTKKGCVGIKGKCLEIEYLDDDQIQIKGIICLVEYENHNRQK